MLISLISLSLIFAVRADDVKKQNVALVNQFISSMPDDVAEFAGKKIRKTYLIEEIMPLLKKSKEDQKALTKEDMDKLKQVSIQTLELLLERELFVVMAERAGFSASNDEIDAGFAKIAANINGGAKSIVSEMGVTESSIKKRVAQGICIEKWMNKFVSGYIPSQQEIEEFYRVHQDRFLIPEKMRISHIFLKSSSADDAKVKAKLEGMAKNAKSEELFKKMALENSEDEKTKNNCGLLGSFSASELPKPFVDALVNLSPGQISQPFRSVRGWHIVRLDEKIPQKYITTEEAYPIIKEFIAENNASLKLRELVEAEKKKLQYKLLWK